MSGPGAEAGQDQVPAGLLEKLLAAVRPEFRAGVLTFDPRDPVFGGDACVVSGCERPARSKSMCWSHRERWVKEGKPDLAWFTASTRPGWAGHRPPPACAVPGCNYCHRARGLCERHFQRWAKAGRPALSGWLAGLDYVPPAPLPGYCLVRACGRWAMPSGPFCHAHYTSWRRAGRPDPGEHAAACADPGPGHEWIDVRCLPGRLRLEIQYVLQCRGDDRQALLVPVRVQAILRDLAATGAASLLERTGEQWAQPGPGGIRIRGGRQFVLAARDRIEQLAFGRGWDAEYPRDKWRLRNLGIPPGKQVATIDFTPVSQPWLAAWARRWCRWRLSAGVSPGNASHGIRAIRRFSAFLAVSAPGSGPGSVDRPLLERYLADLAASLSPASRQGHISELSQFFRDARRHGWDDGSLPAAAVFYPEDYPKLGQRLPRSVAAHVMAQVENPANLDRWDNPAYRLITVILIRCGLRISSAVSLPWNCTVADPHGAPYLLYYNTKMKREALVPIDDELVAMVSAQHDRVRLRWPDGTPVLFPRPQTNLPGTRPVGGSTYRGALYSWLADCGVRDEHGTPVHLTLSRSKIGSGG